MEMPVGDDVDRVSYQIIVMEELQPLDQNLINVLFPYRFDWNSWRTQQKNLLKDENYIYSLSQNLIYSLLRKYKVDEIPPQLRKKINTAAVELVPKLYKLSNILDHKYIMGSLSDISFTLSKVILENIPEFWALIKEYRSDINEEIKYILYQILKSDFPTSFEELLETDREIEDVLQSWENIPETKSFVKLLRSLNEKLNLGFGDIKSSNLMKDKDGNIKIIDIGLYGEPDITPSHSLK